MNKIEIYVLCKDRSRKLALDFLDEFLPEREELVNEYSYPQYSDESKIIDDVNELMCILEEIGNESYSLYWRNVSNSDVETALVFYTEDMGMIVGVVVEEKNCEYILRKLSTFVNAEFGYITIESPPPNNRREFINLCRSSNTMKLIDGKVVKAN